MTEVTASLARCAASPHARAMNLSAGRLLAALTLVALVPVTGHCANPAAGAEVYAQYCRGCHGADGRGTVAGAPDFTRGQGLLSPDASLVRGLRAGGRGMPSYEVLLREHQLLDVVAYLRTLQR